MVAQWNEGQRRSLAAVCDAVFQAHNPEEFKHFLDADAPDYQKAAFNKYISSKYTDIPGSIDTLEEQFRNALSEEKFAEVGFLLSVLDNRAGSTALTGHLTKFADLTAADREQVVRGWATSIVPTRRLAFKVLGTVALFTLYSQYEEIALATGYPAKGDPTRGKDPARIRTHYPYTFEAPAQYMETDVLLVGTGAGGGVVASELSKKGWKMLILDKGAYIKPDALAGNQRDGLKTLYENGGMIGTEDGSLNILAGSTFGGGTTVNWCASLAPQHFIRKEWANEHGLKYFLTSKFADSINAVQDRMGVSSEALKHNIPNSKLVDSAVKLGYHVDKIPQNTNGNAHACGFCSFGCYACEKHGGLVTWLKDAAENGAKFLVNATVEKLLFAADKTGPNPTLRNLDKFTPTSSRRQCIGALVRYEDGGLGIVRAREAVVVSGGSLNSPAILMRSGLKNPRIGKNLKLHPVSYITGYYDELINPWDGAIMTSVSTVAENKDGTNHGCKLEVNMSFSGGTGGAFQKWRGSKEHKSLMLQFNHAYTLIAICRDRGSGTIILDKQGKARVEYTLDPYDGTSILGGVVAGAEIHLVGGARRISTGQSGVPDYIAEPGHRGLADPKWLEWIGLVKSTGMWASRCALGSAHQMGSCQMGVKPSSSVVDPRGRVWGTDSLYVADASVFPTASGVNPMITTMAVSHSISQFIDEDLRTAAAKEVRPNL